MLERRFLPAPFFVTCVAAECQMTNQDLLLADFILSGPQYLAMISSEPYFFFSSRAAHCGMKVKSPIKAALLITMVFHFQIFFFFLLFLVFFLYVQLFFFV